MSKEKALARLRASQECARIDASDEPPVWDFVGHMNKSYARGWHFAMDRAIQILAEEIESDTKSQ